MLPDSIIPASAGDENKTIIGLKQCNCRCKELHML